MFDVHVVALIELCFCVDVSIWLHAPSLYLKLHRIYVKREKRNFVGSVSYYGYTWVLL